MGHDSIDENGRKTSKKSHFLARLELAKGPVRAILEAEFWHSWVGSALATVLVLAVITGAAAFVVLMAVRAVQ